MSDLEESLNNLKKQLDVQQAEMTLMRKAFEDTLEQLETTQAPSYDEEFGTVYQSLESVTKQLTALKKTSLLEHPDQILNRIERASKDNVQQMLDAFEGIRRETYQYHQKMAELITTARKRREQNHWLALVFGCGLAIGVAMNVLIDRLIG